MSLLFKNTVKTVSFDCGGTLYYEVEEDYIVCHRILLKLGYRFEPVEVREALKDARLWWSREKARTREVWNENTWISLLRKMVSNLSIPNQALAEQLRDYWLSQAGFRVYEDAEHTLKKLKDSARAKDSGFQLITVSNVSSSRSLATYLRKAALLEYFVILIASGDVGVEKPNPEIFRVASRLSKTPVEKILHVGDKYEEDYLGARAAGVNAILIDRKGRYGDKQCLKIFSLKELVGLL